MARRITELSKDRPILDQNGVLTQQSRTFFRTLEERAVIIGQGSPNGVVGAVQGASYIDETASTGSVFYIKQLESVGGDTSLGWQLIG